MKTSKRDASTAYHEAGHAVAAWHLGFKVLDASIIRDDESLGHVAIEPEEPSTCDAIARGDRWDTSRFIAEKRAMILQAGDVAQRLYNSKPVRRGHSQDDLKKCVALLRQYAPDERKLDISAHSQLLHTWTAHLIEQNWHLVEAVANALLDCPTLSGTRINEIIGKVEEEHRMMEVQPLLDAVQAIREMRGE
jgi:ATP-dependent Zn protease